MLAKRTLVAAVLLPVGLTVIVLGGFWYFSVILLMLVLAAPEYTQLFKIEGRHPAGWIVVLGTFLLVTSRYLRGFEGSDWIISLAILGAMTFHLVAFERGRTQAGTDFSITLSGVLYLGWIGAYLISLRNLEGGMWWVLTVLPGVWLADTGAYFIGKRFGTHKLCPHLSPKKTWEGYAGGILFSVPGTALLVALYQNWATLPAGITPLNAALMSLVLAVLTPLGDLGESMIKRQAGVKDSGKLLPGHGGMFDRIDSWLWAGVIGYYLIIWLFR